MAKTTTATDEEITALARSKGYGQDAASFLAGYHHCPLGPAEAYPGPARSAHQAGWVAGNREAILTADCHINLEKWSPSGGWVIRCTRHGRISTSANMAGVDRIAARHLAKWARIDAKRYIEDRWFAQARLSSYGGLARMARRNAGWVAK